MSFRRVAALGGFLTVLFAVVGLALAGDAPLFDDPVDDIGRYLADNEAIHRVSNVVQHLLGITVPLFLAGLVHRIWKKERDGDSAWALVVLLGGVVMAAAAAVGDAGLSALLARGGDGLDAETVRVVYDLQGFGYSATGFGIAALIGGTAMANWTYTIWPKWHLWLSWLAALAGLTVILAFLDTGLGFFGYVGFIGFLIWTAATAWLMWKDA